MLDLTTKEIASVMMDAEIKIKPKDKKLTIGTENERIFALTFMEQHQSVLHSWKQKPAAYWQQPLARPKVIGRQLLLHDHRFDE